ncbi:MAG: CotH kinase family protein [Candidatus Hatepunaea meridiana]|nr:CotH kinase family protein [Candidatus Hatepunaea meridiana]
MIIQLKTKIHSGFEVVIVALTLLLLISNPLQSLELRSYYIDCDPDEFTYIIDHPQETREIDCSFEYNHQVRHNVRFRLRGESSRTYRKKSFKLNFDANDRFFGRDKMNLVSGWTDSSFCREFFAYDFYHQAGLPASNVWFVRLYVNNRYIGLYIDVEQIDEHYLVQADFPRDATIFKADGNGCLLRSTDDFERNWEKKTNVETGFYDLHRLIKWLENVPDEIFFDGLEHYFNRQELARVIAVNGIIANTSTYYHNYYLIHNLDQDGKWQMLPWDMDYTFYYRYNHGTPGFLECGHWMMGTNILIVRCWCDWQMREIIFDHICGLVDSVFVEDYYRTFVDTLEDLLYDAVDEDTLKQYSTEQFVNAVRAFPEITAGRGARMADKMENYPLPFDLRSAVVTPDGVFFSWDPTTVPNVSDILYKITLSHSANFPADDVSYITDIESPYLLYDQIDPGQYYWRVEAKSADNKRTSCLSYNSAFAVRENAFRGTTIMDPIVEATTWTVEGSPYRLPEGLTIEADAVLTIESGVVVGIGPDQDVTIEGGLTAIGTRSDSIHFMRLDPLRSWHFIDADHPTDPIRLCFTAISGGYYLVMCHNAQLNVFDSSLRNAWRAIEAWDTPIHLERVHFENFTEEVVATHNSTSIIRSCHFAYGPVNRESQDMLDFNDTRDLLVERCEFYYCDDEAIDLDRVRHARIINNRITGNRGSGISIAGWDADVYIANNIITDCVGGIAVNNHSGVQLYNNILAFNDEGLIVGYEDDGGGAYVRNTVLWRNGTQIVLGVNAALDIAYSMIQGPRVYPGAGNLRLNANFIDQWNRNFELREDSPLIDAGYGTNHPSLDYYDARRVDMPFVNNTGAGAIRYVDIGGFEYGSVGDSNRWTEPPETYLILESYPNPFNSVTRIRFNVINWSMTAVEIFDITGRRVFQRKFERIEPGWHSILWDSRNSAGMKIASGVYFCRVRQEAGERIIKLALIR